jgi:alpha-galactosidase
VERFVLDDGWFLGRRDDTRGLGDWEVDREVWPDGLRPLVERVTALGMSFGLWFEPEMVNLDSESRGRTRSGCSASRAARRRPGASSRCWTSPTRGLRPRPRAADALLTELDISFVKWDHNRDLVEAPTGRAAGRARPDAGAYRLLDELRARHPASRSRAAPPAAPGSTWASSSATDRVWASDTNDPLERQTVQRWTGLLLPPS